jgi:hypothetical protein
MTDDANLLVSNTTNGNFKKIVDGEHVVTFAEHEDIGTDLLPREERYGMRQ